MSVVETNIIRTARKQHRCRNAAAAERGVEWAQVCQRTIEPGQQYQEGDIDPYEAGGFARERFCMACVEAGVA